MSRWIIEATIPVRIMVEAEEELDATIKAIEKISKDFNIEYDRVYIEGKIKIEE